MFLNRILRVIKANVLARKQHTHQKSEKYAEEEPTNQQQNHQSSGNHNQQRAAPPPSPETKYYEALEIQPGAEFEAIKAAYKNMVKKYHPDRFHQDAQKRRYAETVTQQLNEAYSYFEKKFGRG